VADKSETRITLRMPDDIAQELREIAEADRRSMNTTIVLLLERSLRRLTAREHRAHMHAISPDPNNPEIEAFKKVRK